MWRFTLSAHGLSAGFQAANFLDFVQLTARFGNLNVCVHRLSSSYGGRFLRKSLRTLGWTSRPKQWRHGQSHERSDRLSQDEHHNAGRADPALRQCSPRSIAIDERATCRRDRRRGTCVQDRLLRGRPHRGG